MKKLLLFFLFVYNLSFSQEVEKFTYGFLNPEVVSNINDYKLAFSTADMSAFRFEKKRNVIEFKSGLKVELFSVEELKNKNVKLDLESFNKVGTNSSIEYYFTLSKDKKFILRKFVETEFKQKTLTK